MSDKPEVRISAIGRDGTVIYGTVVCNNQTAQFRWDKSTDGLRLFQKTRLLKKEIPPAEDFFVYKNAIIDAIATDVDKFLASESAAMVRPLDELIAAAEAGEGSGCHRKSPTHSR